MGKETKKSSPFGVRFNLELMEHFKKSGIADSPQKTLNFLENHYLKSFDGKKNQAAEMDDLAYRGVKSPETSFPDSKIGKTKIAPQKKVVPVKGLKSPQINQPAPPEGLKGIDLAIWKSENWG